MSPSRKVELDSHLSGVCMHVGLPLTLGRRTKVEAAPSRVSHPKAQGALRQATPPIKMCAHFLSSLSLNRQGRPGGEWSLNFDTGCVWQSLKMVLLPEASLSDCI
jgi:hypothetical protein